MAERVNGILKSEWLDHEQFDNFEQANNRIASIINIHNSIRPHMSCDMLTPEQAQSKEGKLKKRWKKKNNSKKCIFRETSVNLSWFYNLTTGR